MKRMKFVRALVLLLAAILAVMPLAACNKNNKGGNNGNIASTNEFVYVPEFFTIPSEITDINSVYSFGDVLYFSTYTYEYSNDMPMPSIPEAQPFDMPEADMEASGDEMSDGEGEDIGMSESNLDSAMAIPLSSKAIAVPAPTTAPTTEADEEIDTGDEEEDETAQKDTDFASSSDIIIGGKEDYYYPTGTSIYKIYRMNVDGTGLTELTNYTKPSLPGGVPGDYNISSLTVDTNGNLWVYENAYSYGMDTRGNPIDSVNMSFVRMLDETGREVSSVDVSAVGKGLENFNIGMVQIDSNANVYLNGYSWNETDYSQKNYIIVVDSSGKEILKIEQQGWVNNFVKLGDGRIAVSLYDEQEQKEFLKIIDLEKKELGESYPMLRGMYNAFSGDGNFDLYYSDGSNLYGYNLGDAEGTRLVNWIGADINGNDLRATTILQDGRVVCVMNRYEQDSTGMGKSVNEIAVLTKKNASEVEQRVVLTIATIYLDYYLRGHIIDFNKRNGKYRIEVNEYEQYNNYDSEDGYNLGLTKLMTEIVSGSVPDLLITSSGLPIQQYAAKGLLEDIYPYLEKDPEIKRESLVEGYLNAVEIGGKLYQVSPSFSLSALIGRADRVGTERGWTMKEFMDTLARQPEGTKIFPYWTKADVLRQLLYASMNDYVDWQSGNCSFNTGEFAGLLEFADTYPLEIDWEKYDEMENEYEMLRTGKALLTQFYTDPRLENLQMFRAVFGGEISVKGFPSASRGGAVINTDLGIAMTSKCKDKDGAWEFLRTLFSEEYQTSMYIWGFPTSKSALEKSLEEAMKEETYTDESGNEVAVARGTIGWGNGIEVEIKPATQADVDLIMDLINTASGVWNYDEELLKIITDEADPFFAGQKSAQATADIVQGRVTTYVNERR